MKTKLDALDSKILGILMHDARISYTDLAEKCQVSRGVVQQHVQRLTSEGVLVGSGFQVDPCKLGYSTCAFIGLTLERASLIHEVLPLIQAIPEVVECHYTTGQYALLIKIYAVDNRHLRYILADCLQPIKGVASTETLISLADGFCRNPPLPDQLNLPQA